MKNENLENEKIEPKHRDKLRALDSLSLGISMVVAVIIGAGIGIALKNWTGEVWTLWFGIVLGILAAINNVYKAYKRALRDFKDLENDPRYAHRAKYGDGFGTKD